MVNIGEDLDLNVLKAVERVIQLNEDYRFPSLFSEKMKDRSIYYVKNRRGISTIALRTEDLEHHHLVGIMGFRLSQYLQLGWADAELMYRNRWFHEPFNEHTLGKKDLHVICGDAETGQILGYVTTAGVKGNDTHLISEIDRPLFPCEVAHGADIFHDLPWAQDTRLYEVCELKRMVKHQDRGQGETGLLLGLELLAALIETTCLYLPQVRTMVGDLEENGVLRHMRLLQFTVEVIEGTTPSIPETDIMHLMYVKRKSVKPFILHSPEREARLARTRLMQQMLESDMTPLAVYKQIYKKEQTI